MFDEAVCPYCGYVFSETYTFLPNRLMNVSMPIVIAAKKILLYAEQFLLHTGRLKIKALQARFIYVP